MNQFKLHPFFMLLTLSLMIGSFPNVAQAAVAPTTDMVALISKVIEAKGTSKKSGQKLLCTLKLQGSVIGMGSTRVAMVEVDVRSKIVLERKKLSAQKGCKELQRGDGGEFEFTRGSLDTSEYPYTAVLRRAVLRSKASAR